MAALFQKTTSSAKARGRTADDDLTDFISRDPNAKYTFDSERGAPESEICRNVDGKDDCIKIRMYSTQLFEAMQARGFYCALPMDPGRTHMECRKKPKA